MTTRTTNIHGFYPDHFGWRLCEVDGHLLTFTSDLARQCGNGWDDSPADCNAGRAYEPWREGQPSLLRVATVGTFAPDYDPRERMSQDACIARAEIAREADGGRLVRYGMTLAEVVASLSGSPAAVCLPAVLVVWGAP